MVEGRQWCKLTVPNAEIALALADMVQSWLEAQTGGSDELQSLLAALLRGDAPVVERHLGHVLKRSRSTRSTPIRCARSLDLRGIRGRIAACASPHRA
jgi:hypothetical protein